MNSIPPGWVQAALGELVDGLQYGLTASANTEVGGPRFLRITDIERGKIDWSTVPGCVANEQTLNKYRLQENDIVFARTGSIEKAARIVNPPSAVFASYLIMGRPIDPSISPWIGVFVNSQAYVAQAIVMSAGIGRANVNAQNLAKICLPVAPKAEQHRIVDALDSYLSRLDAATASLERVQAKLKAYRASVLKAAVEGRLVPTEAELARQEKRDYEPASVLLARILKERRRRWEEAELARLTKAGKAPKDDRWKAKYEEPEAPDTSGLPKLPEGWCWASLGLMKEFSFYGPRFSSEDYSEDGVLVLRTSDISESGRVNLASPPRLRLSEEDFLKYEARRGDLLITRTGSLGTLAVLNDEVRAIPGAYLIQYRISAPMDTIWFCFHFLKSPAAQARLIGGGQGVGRPNLNAPTIEALPIPLPPLSEQSRIIEEIERLFSVSDRTVACVEEDLTRCSRLRQAILKWAFEGKLVDQDPSDEPAEKLLERIRAEREGAPARRGRGKAKAPVAAVLATSVPEPVLAESKERRPAGPMEQLPLGLSSGEEAGRKKPGVRARKPKKP